MTRGAFRAVDPQFDSFEWDDAKREANLQWHGIDFLLVLPALLEAHLVSPSDRDGEARLLGLVKPGNRCLAVVYTIRNDACRIISVRIARDYEREAYDAHFD